MNGTQQHRQRTVAERCDDLALVVEAMDARIARTFKACEAADETLTEGVHWMTMEYAAHRTAGFWARWRWLLTGR